MSSRQSNCESNGFTLIEVLIATVILAMVGVAAILVERQFIGSASTSKHRLQALGLAQEGINAAKAEFNTKLLSDQTGALGAGEYVINKDTGKFEKLSESNKNSKDTELNKVNFTRTITIP